MEVSSPLVGVAQLIVGRQDHIHVQGSWHPMEEPLNYPHQAWWGHQAKVYARCNTAHGRR